MKKASVIFISLAIVELASCRGHRTCPTYMKANTNAPVTASIK